MNHKVSEEEISAAQAYEKLHVPALFKQFVPVLIAGAGIQPGHRVLDVACGTGIVTRQVASCVGEKGFVAGLDAAAGMLEVARQHAPSLEWRLGSAAALPYEENTFDAVISQFGLMYFQQRTTALREMMRVLTPGGRLSIAVWASLEDTEAYPDLVDLFDRLSGKAAADALRAPFVLGDRDGLIKVFHDAGIDSVDVMTHHGTARFPSIRTLVEAELRGWLPVMGVHLSEEKIETMLNASEQALKRFVTPQGVVEFSVPAHIVTVSK